MTPSPESELAELRMANQIAANFRHHPDDQAAAEVANHLRSFWTPWMLERLERLVDSGGEGLDPLVVRAAALLATPAA
ncbi:MAG: formate dehydrogenase subunit delta [Actinomycetota bacterium]|jgi:formate dehydrogenase subunit delta|nr:formate dehydrogenase subunit delta [Actinomycetota bacterium]